jgi:hypothetical protein
MWFLTYRFCGQQFICISHFPVHTACLAHQHLLWQYWTDMVLKSKLTKHTFSQASKLQICIVECFLHLLIQNLLLATNEDGRTFVQNPLWSTLHHHQISRIIGIFCFMDGHLILICRVERNFTHLLVAFTNGHHVPQGKLHTLKQCSLWSISIHFPAGDVTVNLVISISAKLNLPRSTHFELQYLM